ncbi:VOC family protein [Phenylobacterium sp.]|uniref:VOC family protein n=1 Tax=Phenylobacterium sp. TaxID=1871053 RepID=UPI0025E15FD0|nr:VOC family protein [Phenylobacterium sp.]
MVHLVQTDAAKAHSKVASINHFALRVADIDEAADALTARGVAFEQEDTPGGELRQLYITDPNGVRIELNAAGQSSAAGGVV